MFGDLTKLTEKLEKFADKLEKVDLEAIQKKIATLEVVGAEAFTALQLEMEALGESIEGVTAAIHFHAFCQTLPMYVAPDAEGVQCYSGDRHGAFFNMAIVAFHKADELANAQTPKTEGP